MSSNFTTWRAFAGRFLIALGHLKAGVGVSQAQAEASTVASRLAQAYPKENIGRTARIENFREVMVGNIRPMLWLLFAAVGVILLIACANLANLLLARGLVRHRDLRSLERLEVRHRAKILRVAGG